MKLNLADILVLIFLILKLCKVITWSWWLVFSPWIAIIALAFLAGFFKVLVGK